MEKLENIVSTFTNTRTVIDSITFVIGKQEAKFYCADPDNSEELELDSSYTKGIFSNDSEDILQSLFNIDDETFEDFVLLMRKIREVSKNQIKINYY